LEPVVNCVRFAIYYIIKYNKFLLTKLRLKTL
jgi:hypothetical protein